MVRINLLPQKREARRASSEGSQTWLFAVVGAVVLEVVVLLFVHKAKQDEFARVQRENQKIQQSIDEIKSQISNHAEIKTQLKQLRDREEAITKLQAARTGPTSTLMELSKVLSKDKGPTTDRDKLAQLQRDNPGSVPNVNWDGRRLWLTQFSELERSVRIAGYARDGEDVSELLKRLTLSDYFIEVKLMPAKRESDANAKIDLVKFELNAKVKY